MSESKTGVIAGLVVLLCTLSLAVGVASCSPGGSSGGGEQNPCNGVVCGPDEECDPGTGNCEQIGGEGEGSAPEANFFVSADGDDGADGRTTATAFGTIARAVEALGPGDTLGIMSGTYAEAVLVENFGGSDGTITIRGEGGRATFDGQRTREVGFYCDECTNVVFENLEFTNYSDAGILITGSETGSKNITLRNLVVHDNGFAAGTSPDMEWAEGYGIHADDSSNVTIEDNQVYRNGPNPQVPGKLMGTGINTFNLTDSVIRNNHSYDNTGGGILVEDSANILVEGNEINNNDLDASIEEWWDGGIWLDGGSDVTIRGNNIHDNLGPGIEISDEDLQDPTGYVLDSNTITGNTFGLFIWNFGTTDLPDSSILEVTDSNVITGSTEQNMWIVDWIEGDST